MNTFWIQHNAIKFPSSKLPSGWEFVTTKYSGGWTKLKKKKRWSERSLLSEFYILYIFGISNAYARSDYKYKLEEQEHQNFKYDYMLILN